MKSRIAFFVHLGVLLVAAVAAFVVFSGKEKEPAKGKVILDAEPDDLTRLEYSTSKKSVQVTARPGGGFSLRITEQIRKPAPKEKAEPGKKEATKSETVDAGTVDGGKAGGERPPVLPLPPKVEPPPMLTETREDEYRASKEFVKQLERMLPLYVERDLGSVDGEKRKTFGLDESERTLTIEIGKQKLSFHVGEQSYGGATTYVEQLPDGPVYLMSSSWLRSIDIRAPRYLERRLVEVAKKETDGIAVLPGGPGQSRQLNKIKLDERRDRWVAADEPDADNALFGNWVSKVFRLSADKYLGQDPVPPPGILVRLQFFQGKKPTDELVLASGQDSAGKKEYFARSTFSGTWVKLKPREAEDVISDLDDVLDRN